MGVPEGVRNGGGTAATLTSIDESVVSQMPAAIEIDITSLIIASDLLDQEPRTTDPVRTIVNILAPRLSTKDEEGEEEAGEESGGEESQE